MTVHGRPPREARGRAANVLVLGIALALLIFCSAAGAQADLTISVTGVDTTGFPDISAVVQLGGPASLRAEELAAGAFTVTVDGTPAADLQVRATSAEPLPSATVLLIDESGSMRGTAIQAAAQAAGRFLEAARPGDSVSIQAFNEEFRVLQGFTGDAQDLAGALDQLQPRRETALYDALLRSLTTFEGVAAARSHYLILLSDGGDTASRASLDEVLARARASGVQVYTIGLKTEEFDVTPLVRLAEATGGRYVEAPESAALASLYESLAREIHNQYLLVFQAPASDSGAGEIAVTVSAGGATAEGRSGFFYPAEPGGESSETPATDPVVAVKAEAAPAATEPGLLRRFIVWEPSAYIVPLAISLLVFLALYVGAAALMPRRSVLREYSDVLENRRNLGPQALDATPSCDREKGWSTAFSACADTRIRFSAAWRTPAGPCVTRSSCSSISGGSYSWWPW
ncbi:MAG: VWA domain-containing protein [Thermoleophilia bacterium]|nr:VWA domain-containing protein [Thermoleophilia bacterium]